MASHVPAYIASVAENAVASFTMDTWAMLAAYLYIAFKAIDMKLHLVPSKESTTSNTAKDIMFSKMMLIIMKVLNKSSYLVCVILVLWLPLFIAQVRNP